MLKAYSRERKDIFDAVGTMMGCKKIETDSPSAGAGETNTAAIDKIAAEHMDRLKKEAKVGKKN